MAKKFELPRTFNIAVVGLSGTEKEKGVTGVGKSCLCNRFVRPLADDYHIDHISVLSQTDFSGRVVNNDHFLYWGEVNKTSDEGVDIMFQIIEQTEFIDDSSFQTFKCGKHDPYYKRCTNTKLCSAEKLMYICKNQLGIEKEYEQKLLPDGRFNVDGFLCVFDVSDVQGRSIEKQVEFTAILLGNLLKTKKPVVLATTKHEEARDSFIREAERLLARKELRGTTIPLIETSAHENINVELAFILVAQMIDRAKGRSKVVPFYEAARARKEVLDVATDAYQSLIRSQVTDYRALWNSVIVKFSQNLDFLQYCEQFGQDAAKNMFRRHVKKLKEEYIGRKQQMYIRVLPEVLGELLPDLASIGDGDWSNVREHLHEHPDFSQYFMESPEEQRWQESDLADSKETRIPFDILETQEAEACFEDHREALNAAERRQELRQDFKELLEETGLVTPGKLLSEVRVLFLGRECCELLPDQDLKDIYDDHQREITEKAKQNFQELLLEQAELFYFFASIGPGNVLTQEDFGKITETLQEDSRYKGLDRLAQDRMLMVLQHLGFVHGPIKEHCPANPNCMDTVVDKVVAQKAHRNSQWLLETENNQLSLVLLGTGGLGEMLASSIRGQCNEDTFEVEKVHYTLDFRIIDGDVGLPQNSFRTTNFRPHGCFCVYANHQTLEYIRESLEKTLLSNLEQEDRLPFHGLPIVILFAADASINEKDLMFLREEGQNRAKNLQCPFIDVSSSYDATSPDVDLHPLGDSEGQRFDRSSLNQALHSLIESIQRRAGLLQIYHQLPDHAINPDIRILMCMLCGDPYMVEHVLGPLLSHQCCFVTAPHSVTLETYLGDSKRSVEVRITSYHGANAFRDELVHGFVLVYSTKRKASLATLGAFSNNIPNIPIQILAVTETGSAKDFFSSDLSHQLITEGNAIADKLQAHFMTSTASMQQKTAFYTPFFKEVWERKPQIEKAFHMEDSDYSAESQRTPVPPPVPSRQESYHIRSGSLEDGGDSEGLYEQLPTDTGSRHRIDDECDEPLSPNSAYLDGSTGATLSPSDDSDLYASVFHPGEHQQENGGEHLMKPSRVKNRRSLQAGWAENRIFERDYRSRTEEWLDNEVYHTYHSDRQKIPPPIRPKPGGKPKPGKLNLKQFDHLTDALSRLGTNSSSTGSRSMKHSQQVGATLPKMTGLSHAPLATPESMDLGTEYAQVKDAVYGAPPNDYAYSLVHNAIGQESKPHRVRSLARRQHGNREAYDKDSDSDSEWSSLERRQQRDVYSKVGRKSTLHKKMRKKRGIPVAPPKLPSYEGPTPPPLPPYHPVHQRGGRGALVAAQSLDPLMDKECGGELSPASEGSDLSEDQDPRFKSSLQRPKYKHKRSFRLRKKKVLHGNYPPGAALLGSVSARLPPHHSSPSCGGIASSGEPLNYASLAVTESNLFSPMSKMKVEQTLTCKQPGDEEQETSITNRNTLKGKADQTSIDKTNRKKEERKKNREDEKLEKRRQKEEERLKRQTEKKKKKLGNSAAAAGKHNAGSQPAQGMEDFVQSDEVATPLFVEKCIVFIEEEGLDSEGIYRVPGNRAHVDLLFQKFDEDPRISIRELDIPVNAVATALKDFFSKRLPPLLPASLMDELTDIAGAHQSIQDRSCRLFALRDLLKKLPDVNFEILKYVFQHFVRVTENCRLNSMDSKNLAICWWPTLLPLEFNDMLMFERMRPHLEDSVQTMIDQFRFLFCGQDEVVMV